MSRSAFGVLAALYLLVSPLAVTASVHDGSLADPNIHYVGRWDRTNASGFHSYWTGAYLRTDFTGTSVKIKLASGTNLSVSIDGEPLRDVNAGAGVTDLTAGPLAPGLHTLLAASQGQNFELAFQGLMLEAGAETHPTPSRPIIEFVGDSISAGVNGNYCWQTGEALNADHVQISFSGVALTSGFGCLPNKAGQDVQYFRLKNFNHGDDSPPIGWNFSYTPSVIVINLGQNDQCGAEPDATMMASYVGFARKLRSKFPQAQIVALRTFGGPYADAIQKAVQTLTADGDTRVHYVDTTGWLDKEDFRDGIHPNDTGNLKVTRRLAPLLRPLLGSVAPAATVTVGDPRNPAGLAEAIQNAYNGGARRIKVTPGTYLLPKRGQHNLSLDGWQDATLTANGVTLVSQENEWGHNVVDLRHCTHVTVAGPTLSQTGLTFYQGRVIAVGKDDAGKPFCDWKPDAGYPVPSAADTAKFLGNDANVVDAHTRHLKLGNGDFYGIVAENRGAGTFRAHMGGNFGVGDWLVGRYSGAGFKVHLDGCRDCTIRDVTMMRNGFANVREEGSGGGGNHILHCRWALGPRPTGATEDPLVTNAADGFHSTSANPGPDVEDCSFEGVFLDDCIAVHGYFQTIKSVAGNALTLEGGWGDLKVGQPARISGDKGFFDEGTVTALKDNGDKTVTVTLDKVLDVPASAKVSNPLADGQGCKVIHCHLGDTRSRGILLKGDNDLIRDNTFENCGMSAVSLGPEYYWGESDYVHNAVIENNTFRGNGKAGYGGGTILVHGDGAVGNRGIVIRNNRFSSNYLGDIEISWADGVTISRNTLEAASLWPTVIHSASPILLSNSRNVTLDGNVVKNASSYKPELVAVGKNVTGLTNNDSSGIQATTK